MWRIKWTGKGPVRWIKLYPSMNKRTGETSWQRMKFPLMEILLWETTSDVTRQLRVSQNEIGTCTYRIIHPDSIVQKRRIKWDGTVQELPETEVRKVEPEEFHTLKQLRQRLLGLGGESFTSEVIRTILSYGDYR